MLNSIDCSSMPSGSSVDPKGTKGLEGKEASVTKCVRVSLLPDFSKPWTRCFQSIHAFGRNISS